MKRGWQQEIAAMNKIYGVKTQVIGFGNGLGRAPEEEPLATLVKLSYSGSHYDLIACIV